MDLWWFTWIYPHPPWMYTSFSKGKIIDFQWVISCIPVASGNDWHILLLKPWPSRNSGCCPAKTVDLSSSFCQRLRKGRYHFQGKSSWISTDFHCFWRFFHAFLSVYWTTEGAKLLKCHQRSSRWQDPLEKRWQDSPWKFLSKKNRTYGDFMDFHGDFHAVFMDSGLDVSASNSSPSSKTLGFDACLFHGDLMVD